MTTKEAVRLDTSELAAKLEEARATLETLKDVESGSFVTATVSPGAKADRAHERATVKVSDQLKLIAALEHSYKQQQAAQAGFIRLDRKRHFTETTEALPEKMERMAALNDELAAAALELTRKAAEFQQHAAVVNRAWSTYQQGIHDFADGKQGLRLVNTDMSQVRIGKSGARWLRDSLQSWVGSRRSGRSFGHGVQIELRELGG